MKGVLVVTIGCLIAACATPQDRFDRSMNALPAVGDPVPEFAFPTANQGLATSHQLLGRPTLIALWSSTCQGSLMSVEALNRIQKEFSEAGLHVLLLADDGDPVRPREIMVDHGGQLPFAYASGELRSTFHSSRTRAGRFFGQLTGTRNFALPSFLLVDAQGVVRGKSVGVELEEPRLNYLRTLITGMLASD